MATKIRLKRMGAKARPYYRIVVMDSRSPRDGRTIDELGYYHPVEAVDKQLKVDSQKAKEWLKQGAIPTMTVKKLLNRSQASV